MNIYDSIIQLIGFEPPAEYRMIAWVFCAMILMFLISSAMKVIYSLIKLGTNK